MFALRTSNKTVAILSSLLIKIWVIYIIYDPSVNLYCTCKFPREFKSDF